jgi:hypothetical protein
MHTIQVTGVDALSYGYSQDAWQTSHDASFEALRYPVKRLFQLIATQLSLLFSLRLTAQYKFAQSARLDIKQGRSTGTLSAPTSHD